MNGLEQPDPPLSDGFVTLRPPAQADRVTIVAACQDPEIPRWTRVPSPYTDADAGAFLAMADAGWSVGIGAIFAITAAERPDQLLGMIGLELHSDAPAEVGYWVALEGRGRGLATRALDLISGWGIGELGLERILLVTIVGNVGSERVAAKAGYVLDGPGVCHRCGVDEPAQHWYLDVARSR